jgi:hypothetical protein
VGCAEGLDEVVEASRGEFVPDEADEPVLVTIVVKVIRLVPMSDRGEEKTAGEEEAAEEPVTDACEEEMGVWDEEEASEASVVLATEDIFVAGMPTLPIEATTCPAGREN